MKPKSRRMLKPAVVPKGQEWFWTPEWQAGEREVEEDIRAGRLGGPFSTIDELFNYLEDTDGP